jgi:hypothetical protein
LFKQFPQKRLSLTEDIAETGLTMVFANLWPWLVALAILTFLFWWIPLEALKESFKAGPWIILTAYTCLQVLLVLLADSYATRLSLAITGFRKRFSEIFLVRGSTYVLAILNYSLGQGALGIYLQRSGLSAHHSAGAVLFLLVVNFGTLLFVAGLGLLVGGLSHWSLVGSYLFTFGLAGAMIAYLATVSIRPRFLQEYRLLAPLLDAGLCGYLRAAAGRVPHVVIMVLTYWGAMRLWGIFVPLPHGLVMLSGIFFLNALPLSPAGLGTTQAALVLLFSHYVPFSNPQAQKATVLAFSLAYNFIMITTQAIIGILCWQKLRHL